MDTIVNQRGTEMVCVYVAVGQKSSSVARAIAQIRRHGDFSRCIVVVASPAAAPGLQWMAPFAGFTRAECFRDTGGHALVVIDDLSKHAATHREIALLTGQSPGREAYPGDVFYLHSRLLERAARLSAARGGGTLTALRDAAGHMRLSYAQFLELELFTRFGERPEPRVTVQIERGQRLRALLNQPLFQPLRVVDQVVLALAWDAGLFDPLPVAAVAQVRARLPDWLDHDQPALRQAWAGAARVTPEQRQAALDSVRRLLAVVP